MSDQLYTDYHFKFASADCPAIAPALSSLPNMLGDPFDADGNPYQQPPYDPMQMDIPAPPAFYGARVGDEFYVSFRSSSAFNAVAGLTEITAEEAASILGVWA